MTHTVCSCCSDTSIINQAINRIIAAHEVEACVKVEIMINSLVVLVCIETLKKETSLNFVEKFLDIHADSFHDAILKVV